MAAVKTLYMTAKIALYFMPCVVLILVALVVAEYLAVEARK